MAKKKKPSKKKTAKRTEKKMEQAGEWFTPLLAGNWYRGTDATGKGVGTAYLGRGLYLTWTKMMAEAFAGLAVQESGQGPPKVEAFTLKPGLKILDNLSSLMINIKKELGVQPWEKIESPTFTRLLTKYVQDHGYDGVIDDNPANGMVIFDSKNVIKASMKRNPEYRRNVDEKLQKILRDLKMTNDPLVAQQAFVMLKRAGVRNAGAFWYDWKYSQLDRSTLPVDMVLIPPDSRVYMFWATRVETPFTYNFYCSEHGREHVFDEYYTTHEEPLVPSGPPGSNERRESEQLVQNHIINEYSDTLLNLFNKHPELSDVVLPPWAGYQPVLAGRTEERGDLRNEMLFCSEPGCNLIIKLPTHEIGWEEALVDHVPKAKQRLY